jgi:hypothetical protein
MLGDRRTDSLYRDTFVFVNYLPERLAASEQMSYCGSRVHFTVKIFTSWLVCSSNR